MVKELGVFEDGDFRKASFCDLAQPSPQCVEVACKGDTVAIRDSKDTKSTLFFSRDEWHAFIMGVYNDEFNF